MNITSIYSWEIETDKGSEYTIGDKFDGKVIRVSFIPSITLYPKHDLVFVDETKIKFIRRFSRTFLNWDSAIKERLHCVVTDKFRFYLKSSTGQCLITEPDYEYYI